jgi:hypothetical protein
MRCRRGVSRTGVGAVSVSDASEPPKVEVKKGGPWKSCCFPITNSPSQSNEILVMAMVKHLYHVLLT